ncbi:MAG: DUF5719 family protein [Actinomycetota bacterium]|nr:DUF5719 family protein [Actinomycetota bacterium]MEC9395890.1 DUF5719 family protein [Actinomycetota bacterium]MED6327603.1 DUF5719 family protein [Actinomycetota bacterium]MEE2958356.1 DUF5719 family protein [Actinomycetota bacterium]
MNAARGPALVVLAALVVAGATLGQSGRPDGLVAPEVAASSAVPLSGDVTALWFCPGPTAELDGVDRRSVEVVSVSGRSIEGRVTVVDDGRRTVDREFRIEAGGRLEVEPGRFVPDSLFAAVTVEVSGGAAIVSQAVDGPDGADRRPCPTRTDVTWLVPWSTTTRPGNRSWLLLHNPFQAAAVADLRFVGDIGRRETLDSQGVVVPGQSVVAYDLTERIADSSVVSATVDVRVGRLVAMRLQASDGSDPEGRRGLDLAPGVAGTATSWLLPGAGGGDVATSIGVSVLNPGTESVDVEVVPRFADPEAFAEPWLLVLRAGQRHVVDLSDGRLAGRGEYGIEVRTLDSAVDAEGGAGVATSLVRWSVDGPVGLDVRPASRVAARGWVVDVAARFGAVDDVLAVVNPTSAGIATVSVKVLAGQAPDGLPTTVEVPPGGHLALPLGGGGPVVLAVESTSAVVASVRSDAPDGWTASSMVAVAGTVESLD